MIIALGDGVFVLQVAPKGKEGVLARAIVCTGSGNVPAPDTRIVELDGKTLLTTQLKSVDSTRLPDCKPGTILDVALNGQMKPYAQGLNGRCFGKDTPLTFSRGQCVWLWMTNMTVMAHPMHIHGHTRTLPDGSRLRKDTVPTHPIEVVGADLQAGNPGAWMLHCHSVCHTKLGMMTTLCY